MRIIDNPLLSAGTLVIILMLLSYATGRLHQWYKTTSDREMAFQDGYDTATKSLFSMATRATRNMVKTPVPRGAASVMSLSETAKDDTLTRRPSPKAIGRATARHRAPGEESGEIDRTRVWNAA